jgi:hemoglobin
MGPKAPVAKVKDGELRVPADYKSWPKFLSEVQRPDAKQVREIYMNPAGKGTKEGQPFPNGTILVMENYKAVESGGQLAKGADGKLVKGELAKVFVMGKDEGWGTTAPEGLKNGDWVYAAYDPSGSATPDNLVTCRACHIPLDKKDFVHRYDEYFQRRAQKP